MSRPEWLPESYLLQIKENTCHNCRNVELSSQLWLIEKHYLNKSATRRTEAHFIDARLKRGTTKRSTTSPTCAKCFEPFVPVYTYRDSDLECIKPGNPVAGNGYAGLKLEDL